MKALALAWLAYELFLKKKPAPLTDRLVEPYPPRGDVFIGNPTINDRQSEPGDWNAYPEGLHRP